MVVDLGRAGPKRQAASRLETSRTHPRDRGSSLSKALNRHLGWYRAAAGHGRLQRRRDPVARPSRSLATGAAPARRYADDLVWADT
jgi:hypothetical protein